VAWREGSRQSDRFDPNSWPSWKAASWASI
jgi:hypothetical protein